MSCRRSTFAYASPATANRAAPLRQPADYQGFAPRPLAVALQVFMVSTAAIAAGWAPCVAAQTRQTQSGEIGNSQDARRYDIPTGPLSATLTRFSSVSGAFIVGATEEAKSKTSPGVQGTYTVAQALRALLAGTGLEAVRQADGSYSLTPARTSPEGAATLPAVTVMGLAEPSSTTEGSGSYAANAVTMFGSAQSLKDIPSSVSVMTRQQMDDQNITTINDAMRYSTGVSSINYTGNNGAASAAYYNARGFPINVALDGQSIINGIQYRPQFDMAMYDRVEVFRGPSGLLNGQGDLGGSVNLVRKMPTDTFQIKSETSVGSWADYRQMIDVSGPLNKEGTLRGRVVGLAGTANSFLDAEHSREGMGYAALEYDLDPRTTVSISAGYQSAPIHQYDWGVGYDSDNNIVVGPRGRSQNFGPDWAYESNTIKEASASLKHRFDNGWSAEATILSRQYSTYSKYAFALTPSAGLDTADYSGQRQDATDDWLGLDAHASGPVTLLGRKNDVLLGVNYASLQYKGLYGSEDLGTFNIFSPDIPEPAMPYTSGQKQRLDQFSLYGHVNSHLTDSLSLVFGGKELFYRQQTKTTLPAEGDWNTNAKENGKFVPYGGLVYALTPQVSAYASYSKIFSVQTDTTYSGSAIQPFTAEQYEVGFKSGFLGNRLNATVAAFRINGDHLSVGDQLNPGYYVDSGAVRSQGLETEVSGSPLPNWNVITGYTLANTAYTSSPTNQGQSYNGETPKHLFKLWSTYRFTQGALQGFTVGGGMYFQSNIWRLAPQYHQGSYATFSAKVGYQFNSHLSADITVNNLFDKRYYDRAPYTLFAEYGTPRSVMLTVRASY